MRVGLDIGSTTIKCVVLTASASKEKRSMDEKLGVLFSGPGPCSLPENTYSIPAICVKVVKENSTN